MLQKRIQSECQKASRTAKKRKRKKDAAVAEGGFASGHIGEENAGIFRTPYSQPEAPNLEPDGALTSSLTSGQIGLDNAGIFYTPLNQPEAPNLQPEGTLTSSLTSGQIGLENGASAGSPPPFLEP